MEEKMKKHEKLLIITKRLLIFVAITLLSTAILFSLTFFGIIDRFFVSWLAFQCGIIGGFVSIQQRLNKIGNEELTLLSESWTSILLIPIYGGIFSLILYILFLSSLIQSSLFPEFYIPAFSTPQVTVNDIQKFLTECYPKTGPDLAKLIFWSFVAGFSERYVPQIIQTLTSKKDQHTENEERKPE
jgi:hypothetical protein